MTLLDLIRKLHSEGKPAVAYDLFICENSLMEPEEAVSVGDDDTTVRIVDPFIPPQYLSLGDFPSYVYVEDAKTYRKLTHLKEKIPNRYPRLLVALAADRNAGFYQRYKGKNWKDIPPIEVQWATEDNLVELLLDKDGNFREMAYAGYEGIDDAVTYYPVRSPSGAVFSWQGDITRDPLPEGLTLIAK